MAVVRVTPAPQASSPWGSVRGSVLASKSLSAPRSATLVKTPPPVDIQQTAPRHYRPTQFDIWMLGITIVVGGQYFSWSAGLEAGLYSFLVAFLLIAAAYLTLCCCIAEVTGALPFAGGAYGLSRCTLGFLPGYLIGCCEALEYIAYVATSVDSFSKMVVGLFSDSAHLKPLVSLLFYLSAVGFHVVGDRAFWHFNKALGVVSLGVVIVFVVSAFPYVDFARHADHSEWRFVGGESAFMKVLPLACWFFVGIESLGLASDEVDEPKKVIPRAQIACVITLIASSVAVFFTAVSLPPGIESLSAEMLPLNRGFRLALGLSSKVATILSLPATYATAFGFMWSYGKLISAMAQSRLLPPLLASVSSRFGTPHVAICFGAALSYAMSLAQYFLPALGRQVFSMCILSAFLSYTGQCVGYISLKLTYRNIQRSSFQSPFGLAGAVFSLAVWLVGIVSIVAFQSHGGTETLAFLVVIALLLAVYYAYSRKRQTFSSQENKILLVAHVMKFNTSRAKAKKAAQNRPQNHPRASWGSEPPKMSEQHGGGSNRTLVQPFQAARQ